MGYANNHYKVAAINMMKTWCIEVLPWKPTKNHPENWWLVQMNQKNHFNKKPHDFQEQRR